MKQTVLQGHRMRCRAKFEAYEVGASVDTSRCGKMKKIEAAIGRKILEFAWGFGGKIRFPTRVYFENENYSNLLGFLRTKSDVPLVFLKIEKLFGFARVYLVEK